MESLSSVMVQKDEEGFLKGMSVPSGLVLNFVLKAACELELFDLIGKATAAGGPAMLSADEIALLLPRHSAQASGVIDRILGFLSCHSFFNCMVVTDENPKRLYSLGPQSNIFIKNQDGYSLAPFFLLVWDKVTIDACCRLKEAVVESEESPFEIAHGMNAFEYPAKDVRYNHVFNKGMSNHSSMVINRMLEVYHGFEGVNEMVDVGGGLGATTAAILSKYPNIQAINFDLPHVITNATPLKGVEHIAGDMFESVPTAEVIFMKWILHDWNDNSCVKILRNCHKALPEEGKLIVLEAILPECPDDGLLSSLVFQSDIAMMTVNSGGKERTHREFEILAKGAGFASLKLICRAYTYWVIEFYKKSHSLTHRLS